MLASLLHIQQATRQSSFWISLTDLPGTLMFSDLGAGDSSILAGFIHNFGFFSVFPSLDTSGDLRILAAYAFGGASMPGPVWTPLTRVTTR